MRELDVIFGEIFAQSARSADRAGLGGDFASEAEDEIDNLFHD